MIQEGVKRGMHWATFDPFVLEDAFWQDKMGMPVANRQFLEAFLRYARYTSCRFFCKDIASTEKMRRFLEDLASAVGASAPPMTLPQSLAWEQLRHFPVDLMHHGDFTYFVPYVIEWRNRASGIAPFAVTGLTHSLDVVSIYSKCLSLLLACPRPYDAIICTSVCAHEMLRQAFDYVRERFRESFQAVLPHPPRLVVIPLGFPDWWQPLVTKGEARSRLGWTFDEVVVLCLARFSVRNKMDLSPFLEGCAWVLRKWAEREPFRRCRLVLSGAGKKEDIRLVAELCQKVGVMPEVSIEPNVSSEKKDLLYAASDVFCSLVDNYQETFGLSILEAMHHGLPVIASDFDGYRDLVQHGVTGLLVPTYASSDHEPWDSLAGILEASVLRYHRSQKVAFDMESFVESLSFLITNPEARDRMGEAGRCRAERYRWSVVMREYEDLWEELIQEALKDRNDLSTKEQKLPVLTPYFQTIFGHYATHSLDRNSWITVGSYGREVLLRGFVPVIYAESAPILTAEVLSLIRRLEFCKAYRVEDILDMLERCLGVCREAAQIHLDWLLKHGILTLKKN